MELQQLGSLPRIDEQQQRCMTVLMNLDDALRGLSVDKILKSLESIGTCMISENLHVGLSTEKLVELYEECTTTSCESTLVMECMKWLWFKVNNQVGRKACREEIEKLCKMRMSGSTGRHDAVQNVTNSETKDYSMGDEFKSPMSDGNATLDERAHEVAIKRAEQVTRGLDKFDGISSENYFKWKHVTTQSISNSFIRNDPWAVYYAILSSLKDQALLHARSVPLGIYGNETTARLWAMLDSKYINSFGVGQIEKEYVNLKQGSSESVEAYCSRFLKVLEIKKSVFGTELSDLELKTKFGAGLNPQYNWIKAIADSTCNDFTSFTSSILSFSRNLPIAPPVLGFAAVGTVNRHRENKSTNNKCYRCAAIGHFADKCGSDNIHNMAKRCQKCGTTAHATSVCQARDLVCKRCGKSGHISGICRAKLVVSNVLEVDNESGNEVADLRVENNTMTIQALGTHISQDLKNIVDHSPWSDSIKITKGNRSCTVPDCLKDTGASASFIHKQVAEFLIRNQMILDRRPVNLQVSYANGMCENISECITVMAHVGEDAEEHPISFLITSTCSPRVILGRPILKQIGNKLESNNLTHSSIKCGAVSASNDEVSDPAIVPWIEEQDTALVARFPLFENANVMPYKEKERGFSVIDNNICYARLMQMAKLGKVAIVEARKCHISLAPRLVDKYQELGKIRTFSTIDDLEMHARYRITLDCRPINEMSLIQGESLSSFMLLPPDKNRKTPAKQSQFCAREILQTFPLGNDKSCYAKIDLSDAYGSVRIPERLARLFATVVLDLSGRPISFMWHTLPQGWKHSPFLFTTAINHILRKLDSELEALNTTARHYQDDILLVSSDETCLQQSMTMVINKLESYGFEIRRDKCIGPVSTLVYCGFQLTGGKLIPAPKTPIEKYVISEEVKNFSAAKFSHQKDWVRQWAGRIQYFRDFTMTSTMAEHLDSFYQFLKLDSASENDINQVITDFKKLVSLLLNPVPLVYGFAPTLKCLLLIDANCESWGAILMKCVTCPPVTDEIIEEGLSDLHRIVTDSGISGTFKLLPIKLMAGIFTERERRHSSTHRERIAQLEAFGQCYTYIDAPLIIICDNKNCSLTWHNIDLFGAKHLDLWDKLQSTLSDNGHSWLSRDSAPAMADAIARRVANYTDVDAADIIDDKLNLFATTLADSVQANTADVVTSTNNFVNSSDQTSVDLALVEDTHPELLGSLRRDFIKGIRSDQTCYTGVSLAKIYEVLVQNKQDSSRASKIAFRRFTLIDGVLFYCSTFGHRCVVPNSDTTHLLPGKSVNCRAGILHIFHDKMSHPGSTRLSINIGDKWYWPQMYSDIKKYVAGCSNCRLAIPSRLPSGEGELGSLAIRSDDPWQVLMMDFCTYVGPDFQQDILLIIDCYSHWLFSFLVNDQTAMTVASILKILFRTIGFPKTIISDNGTHFVNDTIKELGTQLGFNIWTGSARHPQRQGLIERTVGEIKLGIKKMQSTQYTLHEDIQNATMLHNMSPFLYHKDICPYSLVYGRKPRWLLNPDFVSKSNIDESNVDIKILREVWEKARVLNQEKLNDNSIAKPRKALKSGMKVIWRYPNDVPVIKTLVEEAPGVGNHWILSDGRQVPEAQLEPFVDEVPELRAENLPHWDVAKLDDLILFLRDGHMDVGRVIKFIDNSVLVVNLYMDEFSRWFEHGEEYTDLIPFDHVIKTVKLTKDNKVDRRYLH